MRIRGAPGPARAVAWGLLVVVAYLVTASLTLGSGRLPLRPFFEGTAPPQPYRWVNPADDVAAANQPPTPGNGTVKLGPNGSEAASIVTNDGQAAVVISQGSIRAKPGEAQVAVSIQPLDPATIGPPPKGFRYEGNAYRFSATYEKSKTPAEFAATSCPAGQQPKLCPTIVLRYPYRATGLFSRSGSTWEKITATPAQASLQIFGDAPALGTFVAGALPVPGPSRTGDYVAIALGGVAVIAGAVAARSRPVRRSWRRWRTNRKVVARRKASAASRRPSAPPRKRKPPAKTYGKRKRKR